MVPRSACVNRPRRGRSALVKAPLVWPKSSLSIRFSGIAPQFTATKGPSRRDESSWMRRALTPLPVPLSPVISTVLSVGATRLTSRSIACMAGEANWKAGCGPPITSVRSARFSSRRPCIASICSRRCRISSLRTGLVM